jgi:hypothetical protein
MKEVVEGQEEEQYEKRKQEVRALMTKEVSVTGERKKNLRV